MPLTGAVITGNVSRMKIREYSTQAAATAIYPGRGGFVGVLYCALGLGEAGEVQGKVKKLLRDDNGVISNERRVEILSELGDVLWYVDRMAAELGADLEQVARMNLAKLADRADRGVLGGSGDTR